MESRKTVGIRVAHSVEAVRRYRVEGVAHNVVGPEGR